MAPPDRLERLTDLVLVLLHATRPLTLDEIAHEVPGYPANHGARRQAFERDKRLLRDEGVPVVTEPIAGHEQFGYRIDPDDLYLPDLELSPAEYAALHLAVAAVELGDPSGRDALLKLGATGLAETRPVAALAPSEALVPLFEAARQRAQVTFGYRGEQRAVAPVGLWFRNGHWYLVGWDRARSAARTFRVDRMEGWPDTGPPGSGAFPDDFDPSAAAPEEPWHAGPAVAGDVLVMVDAIEAPRVVDEVGAQAVEERRPDGSVLLRLGVSSGTATRSWVLGLLDHAEVVGPPDRRRDMVAWLEALAAGPIGDGPIGAGPIGAGPIGAGPIDAGTAVSGAGTSGPGGPVGAPDVAVAQEPAGAGSAGAGGARPDGGPGGAAVRTARQRLRRLLAIVGWLARVGEAPIADVARRFGIPEAEVVHELELAACCGRPPYSPDMLLEIVVTDETVTTFLPEELARPRRLTPAEGFALAAAARTIQAVPGADEDGSLARALAKLEAALGGRPNLVVDLDEPRLLDAARRSVDERSQLEIEYHSGSTDETTTRRIDPLAVRSLDGHWYVDAYCHRAGGLRRFRVDRIRSLSVLGPQPPGHDGRPAGESLAFVPGPGAVPVRLALDPEAAWVADSIPVLDVRPGPGAGQEVTLAVGGRAWLERLLLQVGPHARVLDPPELVGTGPSAARRVLARYRPPVSGD